MSENSYFISSVAGSMCPPDWRKRSRIGQLPCGVEGKQVVAHGQDNYHELSAICGLRKHCLIYTTPCGDSR